MAAAKTNTLPLTINGNVNNPVEETSSQKNSLLPEHILLSPETYIGSTEKHTRDMWVYESEGMVHRSVTYVPGLYKIFDEILVDAAANKKRDPNMDELKVTIDVEDNLIRVSYTNISLVDIHREEQVFVPELISLTKLTNIFSTDFVIETVDAKRQLKFIQVFSNNMGTKSDPAIEKCDMLPKNWTRVSFKPDLSRFNMAVLEKDVVALMKKRVIDMAGCLGKAVKVFLDGKQVSLNSFHDYARLYLRASKSPLLCVETGNEGWNICVSLSTQGQFQQVSFVNNIATINGGTHVNYVTNQIIKYMVPMVNNKKRSAKIKKSLNLKNHLWLFVNATIDNPAFDSPITKEALSLSQSSFVFEIPKTFLEQVAGSEIVNTLLSWDTSKKLSKDMGKGDTLKKLSKGMVKALELYEKRKKSVLDKLEIELSKLENKINFIQGYLKEGGVIPEISESRDSLIKVLEQNGFTPHPKKMKTITIKAGDDGRADYVEPDREEVKATGYDYLVSIPVRKMKRENDKGLLEELCLVREKLLPDVKSLKEFPTPKVPCEKDLEALEMYELVERYNVRVADMAGIPHTWRKFGHALLFESPYPRHYYKCSVKGCLAKKRAERVVDNPENLLVTYEEDHDHSMAPSARRKRQALGKAPAKQPRKKPKVEDDEVNEIFEVDEVKVKLSRDEFYWENCKAKCDIGDPPTNMLLYWTIGYEQEQQEKGQAEKGEEVCAK